MRDMKNSVSHPCIFTSSHVHRRVSLHFVHTVPVTAYSYGTSPAYCVTHITIYVIQRQFLPCTFIVFTF